MIETSGPKKPSRRAGDADVLALAEGLCVSLGKTFNLGDIETLLTVAESYPDTGRDGAGGVVKGLEGPLEHFVATGAYDRQAIAVHIRAWRFMVSHKPDKKQRAAVMNGLDDVRQHYTGADAA